MLYNTTNPFNQLLNNMVSNNYICINCKNVIDLICEDRYNIIPKGLLEKIHTRVGYVCTNIDKICKPKKEKEKKLEIENKDKNYISNIFKDLVEKEYIPHCYDDLKVKMVLQDNNLLYSNNNHFFATNYALENKYYIIRNSNKKYDDGTPKQLYYITEKGKDLITNIFKNYEDKDSLVYEKPNQL